jgi:hypothetical protein
MGPFSHIFTRPDEPAGSVAVTDPCVVVLFTASHCDEDPRTRCVMDVIGPMTRNEAESLALGQPEWQLPHVMRLHEPADLEA